MWIVHLNRRVGQEELWHANVHAVQYTYVESKWANIKRISAVLNLKIGLILDQPPGSIHEQNDAIENYTT